MCNNVKLHEIINTMTDHATPSMKSCVFSDINDTHQVKSDESGSEDQTFQPALKNKILKHHKKQINYKCDVCGDDFGSPNFLQVLIYCFIFAVYFNSLINLILL